MEAREAHGWSDDYGYGYGRDQAHLGDQGDVIDLRAIWFAFRRRLGLFVAVAGVIFTFAVIFTMQLEPKYQPSARVLIDPRTREYVPLQSVQSNLRPDDAIVLTEVQVIRSRSLAERVVDDLRLDEDPEFNALLRPSSGFSAFVEQTRGALGNVLGVFAPSAGPSGADYEPSAEELAAVGRELAITALQQTTTVSPVESTYVINIEAISADPDKAASIANALADEYLVDQLESKLAANRRANEWLVERLAEMADEVSIADAAVETYRAQAGLLDAGAAGGGSTLAEQRIAQLNAQLVIERTDLRERRAILSTAGRYEAGDRSNLPAVLSSALYQQLRGQRADVVRQQGQLSATLGPLHPDMIAINQQLADIDAEIDNEVDRIIASISAEVNTARERVEALEEELEALETELETDNVSLIRLRQLEAEAESKRALYETYYERRQNLSESEFLLEPDARIISEARPPLWPSAPNRKVLLILGLALSLGCAAAALFVVESLDGGLRTASDVESVLAKRCLGTLPRVTTGMLRRETVASVAARVVDKPFSAYAESVRSLRASLLLSADRRGARSVMVTSALQGEGKSSLAFSLARMSAMMNVKTVIVDADLRRRQLTLAASAAANAGLLNVFDGSANLTDVVIKDTKTDLDILPAGRVTGGQGEIFSLPKLDEVLKTLAQHYDFIVVDSTPLLAVAEGREISTIVDTVLVAARWRKSPRATVKSAIRVLDSVDAPVAGVALTQANMRLRALYAGEGVYQAEYGSYYRE
ncbi:MAG: polysaccharide biosynthesis tyrosine autokinase [Maricaulaceae bacterium]|jgi:capsular exopolysaccharide synthesis family protein